MKIIIGLGNPGTEYAGTRHNIGFAIVDKLKDELGSSEWEFNKKFNAEISKGAETLLVKPQTFMNLSGVVAKTILDFYKLTPDNILIIHDDLDIAIGKYKVATDSSSAGHNGVQNIIDQLGTQIFKRVRIGVGEVADEDAIKCRLDAHDFVLGKFSDEEQKKITDIISKVISEIKKMAGSI